MCLLLAALVATRQITVARALIAMNKQGLFDRY